MNPAYAAITFLSYANLEAGIRFYHGRLGLPLIEDQGWAKIYRICETAFVGLVLAKSAPEPPVGSGSLLSITVTDVDTWYDMLKECADVELLSEPAMVPGIPVYSFFLKDPGGYRVEIQSFADPQTAARFGAP